MQTNITVFNPELINSVPNPNLVYPNYNTYLNTTFYNIGYEYGNEYGNVYYNSLITNIINIDIQSVINSIPMVADRVIPRGSTDIITYEDINHGDILVDFKRDTKTEYYYGAFYKESNLETLLKSNRNQFTMKLLDISSLVKYKCLIN